jgi:FKBP-type peptidyl-prolyl cis-trans isomerase (trigger factor)
MQLLKRIFTPLIAVLLLTGCSSMSSGVSVGDTSFSGQQIQKVVDEILDARKDIDTTQMQLSQGPELLRDQAQFFIVTALLDQIAKEKNIVVTKADVAARRAEIVTNVGGESELPKALVGANLAQSNLDAYLKILIISERLDAYFINSGTPQAQAPELVAKAVTDIANKLGVEVNPKYGKWNPTNTSIEASDATDGAVTQLP